MITGMFSLWFSTIGIFFSSPVFLVGIFLLIISNILLYILCSYGIYLLAKKYEPTIHPIWSWIPIVNLYPLVKVSGQPTWFIAGILLFWIIPFFGVIAIFVLVIKIAHGVSKKTGHDSGTTILILFFPYISLPWIGLKVNERKMTFIWVTIGGIIILTIVGQDYLSKGAAQVMLSPDFQEKMTKNMQNNAFIDSMKIDESNNFSYNVDNLGAVREIPSGENTMEEVQTPTTPVTNKPINENGDINKGARLTTMLYRRQKELSLLENKLFLEGESQEIEQKIIEIKQKIHDLQTMITELAESNKIN